MEAEGERKRRSIYGGGGFSLYLGSDGGIGTGTEAPYQEFGETLIGVNSPLSQPRSCSEPYGSVNHPSQQKARDGFELTRHVSPPRSAKVIQSNSDVAGPPYTNAPGLATKGRRCE